MEFSRGGRAGLSGPRSRLVSASSTLKLDGVLVLRSYPLMEKAQSH